MKIQYIGAYLNLSSGGETFTRYIPKNVSLAVGEKLLSLTINGKAIFAVVGASAPVLEEAAV